MYVLSRLFNPCHKNFLTWVRFQATFRGHRVRKTYLAQKEKLLRHEQLRKDAAKLVENRNISFCVTMVAFNFGFYFLNLGRRRKRNTSEKKIFETRERLRNVESKAPHLNPVLTVNIKTSGNLEANAIHDPYYESTQYMYSIDIQRTCVDVGQIEVSNFCLA